MIIKIQMQPGHVAEAQFDVAAAAGGNDRTLDLKIEE